MPFTSELSDPPRISREDDEDQDESNKSSSGTVSDIESGTGNSSTHQSTSEGTNGEDSHLAMIKREERAVKRAKLFVGLSVFFCAVAVIVAVYLLTSTSDTRSFELAVSNTRTWLQQKCEFAFSRCDRFLNHSPSLWCTLL